MDTTHSYLDLNEGVKSLEQINCLMGTNPILHEGFSYELTRQKTQLAQQIAITPYPKSGTLRKELENEILRSYRLKDGDVAIFLQRAVCGCLKMIADAILLDTLKKRNTFTPLKVLMPCPEFEIPVRLGEKYYQYFLCPINFKKAHQPEAIDQLVDRYVETIKSENPDIVYFSNPNNPFGFVFSDEHLFYIYEQAQKQDTYIFADEAYMAWKGLGYSSVKYVSAFPNLIVMSSLSKFHHAANIRIGWAVGNKKLNDLFKNAEDNLSLDEFSNRMGHKIVKLMNDQPTIPNYFRREVRRIKEKLIWALKNVYEDELRISVTDSQVSIFTIITQNPNLHIMETMRNANILVVPGDNFYHEEMNAKNSARVRIPGRIEYVDEIERRLLFMK